MWQSFHAFHEGPDELLTGCIAPLVASLQERSLISGFFFLRYWARGFHLRLRFRTAGAEAVQLVDDTVMGTVQDHMDRRPSTRSLDPLAYETLQKEYAAREGLTEAPADLVSNNTIIRERYEPEFDKYGGPAGVALAEELFDCSAACALALVPTFAGSQSRRLGSAFTMMLLALRSFEVPMDRMADFLRRYAALWLDSGPTSMDQLRERAQAVGMEQLRGHIQLFHRGVAPRPGPMQLWADALSAAARALSDQETRVLPFVRPSSGELNPTACRAWLLAQYTHTHNNRLGILPAEEAYLGTLAAAALEAVV